MTQSPPITVRGDEAVFSGATSLEDRISQEKKIDHPEMSLQEKRRRLLLAQTQKDQKQ